MKAPSLGGCWWREGRPAACGSRPYGSLVGSPARGFRRRPRKGCASFSSGENPTRRRRATFFTHHGLPVLFAAVGIESFGIPVPGETALIAFGVLASQGHYSIVVVIAVAATAAIVGDNLGFWLIGRRGGRALLARYPRLERRAERVLPRTEALIDRYGGRAVFFGRFVSVLRETVAWVAGLAGMPWPRFLFWNAAGGIVWATGVGLLAYYGGKALADTVSRYGLYAGAALAVVVVLLVTVPMLVARRLSRGGGDVTP